MRMKGVQLLRRVELLMMKRGLMIATEGVPPRLVPRAAASGGAAAPRATPAAAAAVDSEQAGLFDTDGNAFGDPGQFDLQPGRYVFESQFDLQTYCNFLIA